jgi:hypothetical protein
MQPFLLNTPMDPNIKWVVIALAGATILYTVIRPAMKRKDPLAKARPITSLAQQRGVERQMQNLLVELSEMARQLTAQLDTRSQKLELLLQEADEKIAALHQAANTAPNSEPTVTPAEREAWTIRPEPEPTPVDARHQEVYVLADQGQAAPEIARQLNRPRGEVELILALRPRG